MTSFIPLIETECVRSLKCVEAPGKNEALVGDQGRRFWTYVAVSGLRRRRRSEASLTQSSPGILTGRDVDVKSPQNWPERDHFGNVIFSKDKPEQELIVEGCLSSQSSRVFVGIQLSSSLQLPPSASAITLLIVDFRLEPAKTKGPNPDPCGTPDKSLQSSSPTENELLPFSGEGCITQASCRVGECRVQIV
ncbi:hypothetical protein J6590_004627 [Homalodisca vitripennis]|nr:hypothetical protein J6590_004627 [Homalodisca vitripennis]